MREKYGGGGTGGGVGEFRRLTGQARLEELSGCSAYGGWLGGDERRQELEDDLGFHAPLWSESVRSFNLESSLGEFLVIIMVCGVHYNMVGGLLGIHLVRLKSAKIGQEQKRSETFTRRPKKKRKKR